MVLIVQFIVMSTVAIVNLRQLCFANDFKIEVGSHIAENGQLNGKLYVDEAKVIVLCRVTNARSDLSPSLHQAYGHTLTAMGHAPQIVLQNDTWTKTFKFPLNSWRSSQGCWRMDIARKDSCFTDKVHKQWLAEVTIGTGAGKLSAKTVVIDLHTDFLWHGEFGSFLGPMLGNSISKEGVSGMAVAQHPCTPDIALLALQCGKDIIMGVSHDMFLPAYTAWYNVTDSICEHHFRNVCADLVLVDITVTTDYVLLLTTKGLFVGQLLSVEARQVAQFEWVPVPLPNNFLASVYRDSQLRYTSVCTSPKHAGDTQEEERVILLVKTASQPDGEPYVSLPPFTSWSPVMTHTVTARSLVYDYETQRYLVAQQEVVSNNILIITYPVHWTQPSIQETIPSSPPFKFPPSVNFILNGICLHSGTHQIYAYGTQVWLSIDSGNRFSKLLDLPTNDTITSCVTGMNQGVVLFISSSGVIYYGKAGVSRLTRLEPQPISSDQIFTAAYITLAGQVILLEIDKENNTLQVESIDVSTASQVPVQAYGIPLVVQFLSKRFVVLFDLYRSDSLTKASVGQQLTHRVSGSILINEVSHVLQKDGPAITMARGHVIEMFAADSASLSPALQYNLRLETINGTVQWLKLLGVTDPSTGWYSSDVDKTVTMAGASSILITTFHNYTHAIGIVILPQLIHREYPAGKWRLYNMRPYKELARVNEQVLHIDATTAAASLDVGTFSFKKDLHQGHILKTSGAIASISHVIDENNVQLNFLYGTIDGDILPGDWSLYEAIEDASTPTPKSLWSVEEPKCSHVLTPDAAASQYPVRFLDVGYSFTFSVTAAVTKPGATQSKKPLLFLTISNPKLFHTEASYATDRFGSETLTVTLRHEIFNSGISTVIIHMPDASLMCPKTSFILTIKCACPPSKRLHFAYDPFIPSEEFLKGNPKDKRNKPLLIDLKPNYRPPSHLGIAIPLSDNVYNADPARSSRPRDYYQISKESGHYKQCKGKASSEECGCTDDMKLSSLQRDTDCRARAYRLIHPGKVWPTFVISEQDKEDQWLSDPYVLTLSEVNNRANYLVTDNPSASLIEMKEADLKLANGSQLYSTKGLKIVLLGSELYHFRASVIEGFSYCPLQDEFQVYVDKPPLAYPTQMIIIASVSVGIGGALFLIFLYYLRKHYTPPVRIVGSQCMDIHHQH